MRILIALAVTLSFSYFTYWHGWDRGYVSAAETLGATAELATGMINKCVNGIPYRRSN